MSQSPAPSSTSKTPATTASSSNFEVIFKRALRAYQKKTKQNLTDHPLATQLHACDSPVAVLTILQDQVDQFKQSRSGDERLQKWLSPTINVLYTFSATLGEGVGLVFSPAKVIFAGAGVLLLAARDVETSEDVLIDVFERIENFFRRLEIYTDVPPTTAMTEMMVKIMVEVLDILGTATKEMKQGRAKKFLKKVAGIRKLEDGLKKLDKMTNEEARMAGSEVLRLAHNIDKKVERVDENIKAVGEKVLTAIDDGKGAALEAKLVLQTTAHNVDDVKRRQLLEGLRKWQSPSDPSTNHAIASDYQHEGTAEWLCKGDIFKEWKVIGSLMWIHGKPGSGKSILCSAIINDIENLHEAGLASMAYFYFDFRDADKRSRRDLLRSLLIQLSARSDPFCDILSRLYKKCDDGTRQPSDSALVRCLKEMLNLPDQGPVYLIMDALDECPNISGVRTSREKVLDLVKELIGLRLPSVHICMTSRPEVDIRYALEGLAAYSVSLHNENGQKKDIEEYIKSVVHSPSDTIMKGWREEVKDLVIETLSERADGMFRWVFCQLEMLRGCFPQNVPRVLTQLPASLDETYERVLKEIGKTKQSYAYRLLQCLAVAIRPLRVEELAEILALDFDGAGEAIPGLKEDWRWKDQQEVVLSTCSSLLSVVDDGAHRVVQFSHYSVKEFLTSDRLATSREDISHFHILPEPAHAVIAKACLGILLQSENGVGDAEDENNSPLAKYAAEHWVNHAQFEKVSTRIEDGMRRLFDPTKQYLEAWLMLHDINEIWYDFTGFYNDKQHGSPLYYASLCGFCDLAAHLLAGNPKHVNASVGQNRSPLAAALYKGHFDIADLLYQHSADTDIRGKSNRTLLHASSASGFVDVFHWLVDHGIDPNSRKDNYKAPLHLSETNRHLGYIMNEAAEDDSKNTPLHLASEGGHFEIVLQLLSHGADVTANGSLNRTPLHQASSWNGRTYDNERPNVKAEILQVLVKHGADVNARDWRHKTPLHLASSSGSAEGVQLLIEHGADSNARDESHFTPLHLASYAGNDETVRLLIENGADVTVRDQSHSMPLHLASFWDEWIFSYAKPNVKAEIVQLLMKHGADVNARDRSHSTPLHLASSKGSAETVRLLIENGANIIAQDENHNTPLHLASSWDEWLYHYAKPNAKEETVQLLLKNGADVNSRDGSHSTPLHLASSAGSFETVRLLIEHGVDVALRDHRHNMPLHLVSSWDERRYLEARPNVKAEVVQLLLKNGADVNSRDGSHSTPLHLASSKGSAETVRLLIDSGADVTAQDLVQNTPLHQASSWDEWRDHDAKSSVKAEIVQVLMKHGANVNARDGGHKTPLHLASSSGGVETVRLLIEHGADVNVQDHSHSMPLHMASSQGVLSSALSYWANPSAIAETARVLIEHGADVLAPDGSQMMPLHLASSSGSAETVRVLIEHGADINSRDGSSSTPLHMALFNGSTESVHTLINHGADVNAQDARNTTPLHLASSFGAAETVQLLNRHRVLISARDESDPKPLHQVSSSWGPEQVLLLVEHGADVNARDGSHQTPLHLASSSGIAETVRLLIDHGADVNARDRSHSTPLHLALSLWIPENVWPSINHGANFNVEDGRHVLSLILESSKDEKLPMQLLREESDENSETVRGLDQHTADVGVQDNIYSMPLPLGRSERSGEISHDGADVSTHLPLAALSRLALEGDIVRLLLEHGANVDAEDDQCRTPLQIASSVGLSDIAQLLSDHRAKEE